MSNILQAILNIEKSASTQLRASRNAANRMNSIGEGLEAYIKDAFAGTIDETNLETKDVAVSKVFSYLGNANNIPDAMLKGGDAIEVKKIQGFNSGIALNSSYPKDKLYSDDHRVSKACRESEDWESKDIIYAIGIVPKKGKLKHLWMVYGDCYAANREVYTRIGSTIKEGVETIVDVEFSETKELGRVNAVDPLGITYLRIRGMWHIENPLTVYKNIYEVNKELSFSLSCILQKSKFDSFPKKDRDAIKNNKNITTKDIKIKNPNNPAQMLDAVLITIEEK